MMFKYDDQGLGPGKWLYGFMALIAVAGLLSFFPENSVAGKFGWILGMAGAGIAYRQFLRWWREK